MRAVVPRGDSAKRRSRRPGAGAVAAAAVTAGTLCGQRRPLAARRSASVPSVDGGAGVASAGAGTVVVSGTAGGCGSGVGALGSAGAAGTCGTGTGDGAGAASGAGAGAAGTGS